jgi:hypothetical protein
MPALRIAVSFLLSACCAYTAAPVFSLLLGGSGQDYATSVTSDSKGNIYVAGLTYSSDFPITSGAFQTRFGGTCDAFVTKLSPTGTVIWSTLLGGVLDDWANSIALDRSGNVIVAGYTRSPDFPLSHPLQAMLNNNPVVSGNYDAFVAKLDPSGAKLLYSTFLGGQGGEGAAGLAVDPFGNAYVALTTNSAVGYPGINVPAPNAFGILVSKISPAGMLAYSYFHPTGTAGAIAIDSAGSAYVAGATGTNVTAFLSLNAGPPPASLAIAFKLSPDGSTMLYEKTFGGSLPSAATAIAVNRAGEAYLAGFTSSLDFPLVNPLESSLGARPLWKNPGVGNSWSPIDNLPFAITRDLVSDPSAPSVIFAASSDNGVLKSTDNGLTWAPSSHGIDGLDVRAIAVDPARTQILYAAVATKNSSGAFAKSDVYRSLDGAASWEQIDSAPYPISQLSVDPLTPDTVYSAGLAARISTNAGTTWQPIAFPGSILSFGIDPQVSGHLFGVSSPIFCGFTCAQNQPSYLYRSVDAGATWMQAATSASLTSILVDSSTNPSTIYNGLAMRSVDGGVTWMPFGSLPFSISSITASAIDAHGVLYAAVSADGIYTSLDRGITWTNLGGPASPPSPPPYTPAIHKLFTVVGSMGVMASLSHLATGGFVARLNADGSMLRYSTYVNGHASTGPVAAYAAEPDLFLTQTWISGIALDLAGNVTIAGGTRSIDMPLVNPTQSSNAGFADAFAATLSPDGSQFNLSTYWGGSQDDGALGVSLDKRGNILVVGQTRSTDQYLSTAPQTPYGYGDAFVLKLAGVSPSLQLTPPRKPGHK